MDAAPEGHLEEIEYENDASVAPPAPKIVIDMAGALEKITPEMMDATKDILIDGLMESCDEYRKALVKITECWDLDEAIEVAEWALGKKKEEEDKA